jgi:hypothetical protein
MKQARLPGIEVTSEKLASYNAAAQAKGVTFSTWVRGALDQSSGYTESDQDDRART